MSALAWTYASRPFVRAVSWSRLLARCISCYLQILKEHDELRQLSRRSLQDIGLTPQDVETIMRRPTLSRCWQWVHSCRRNQCHATIVCKARCDESGCRARLAVSGRPGREASAPVALRAAQRHQRRCRQSGLRTAAAPTQRARQLHPESDIPDASTRPGMDVCLRSRFSGELVRCSYLLECTGTHGLFELLGR